MPDDRLDHVGLRLRVQLRDVRQRQVVDVIAAATVVVADVVTLLAIPYRMIPVVARALRREADADGQFIRRSAVLYKRQSLVTGNKMEMSERPAEYRSETYLRL